MAPLWTPTHEPHQRRQPTNPKELSSSFARMSEVLYGVYGVARVAKQFGINFCHRPPYQVCPKYCATGVGVITASVRQHSALLGTNNMQQQDYSL